MATMTDHKQPGLTGNLGVLSLMATVIAFNGPLGILAGYIPIILSQGNGLATPLTFAALMVIVMIFAVGLNAMAARMTHPGAFYTYVTAGLGRAFGLAAGLVAMISYLAIGAGTYALFAVMVKALLGTTFGITGGPPWWVWALAGWAACTALSLFNIEVSARILGVLMLCEVAIIVVWDIVVLHDGGPEGWTFDPFSDFFTAGSFPLAMVFGLLVLTGFESLQVFRSETRNPEKTVPRATYLSIIFLGLLHIVSATCYIIAYGPGKALTAGATDPTGSVLATLTLYVSKFAADAANVLLCTSIFAAALSIQNISTRYFFMFGRDRVLPASLGEVSAKHGSPLRAGVASGLLMLIVWGGFAVFNFDEVITYSLLTGLGTYWLIVLWVATSLSVVFFFRRGRAAESLGPWPSLIAPVISLVTLGAILILATIYLGDVLGGHDTVADGSLVLLAAMIGGGIGLAMWYQRNRPDTYKRIGNQVESMDLS
jgi:amino acid transporter